MYRIWIVKSGTIMEVWAILLYRVCMETPRSVRHHMKRKDRWKKFETSPVFPFSHVNDSADKHRAKDPSIILKKQILNHCCFKPLIFVMVCFATVVNWNRQVPWKGCFMNMLITILVKKIRYKVRKRRSSLGILSSR